MSESSPIVQSARREGMMSLGPTARLTEKGRFNDEWVAEKGRDDTKRDVTPVTSRDLALAFIDLDHFAHTLSQPPCLVSPAAAPTLPGLLSL